MNELVKLGQEGGVANVFSVEEDIDMETTSTFELVFSSVSTVVVINSFGIDAGFFLLGLGTSMGDFNFEAIASIGLGYTVLIDSMNGDRKYTHIGIGTVSSRNDLGNARRTSHIFTFAIRSGQDRNVIFTGKVSFIDYGICAIFVVGNVRCNRRRTGDCHTRMSINDGLHVLIVQVNSEACGLVVKTFSETRTFNIGISCVRLRVYSQGKWRAFNMSTRMGDFHSVLTRMNGRHGSGAGT